MQLKMGSNLKRCKFVLLISMAPQWGFECVRRGPRRQYKYSYNTDCNVAIQAVGADLCSVETGNL